jgi:hypothetical protein
MAAVGVLAGCSAHRDGLFVPFGPFSGYRWRGSVTAVEASILVPRIAKGSPAGAGATWIGAQTDQPGSPFAFLQLGIFEGRETSPDGSQTRDTYLAFWSDPAHHLRPIVLGSVQAGDRVDANLRLVRHAWRVSLADVTSGARATFVTRDETAPMLEALWTQEDPSRVVGDVAADYPQLSAVRFSQVEVNEHRPTLAGLNFSWMALAPQVLAPTALRQGAFVLSLRPPTVSAAARRYLMLSARSSRADQLVSTAERWTVHTPRATRQAIGQALAIDANNGARQLAMVSWPTAARRPVRADIRADRMLSVQSRSAGTLGSAQIGGWQKTLAADVENVIAGGTAIARALNAPLLTYEMT